MWRLNSCPVVTISVPNSIYFPARSQAERDIISRVVSQMKSTGQITVGAPDLCVASAKGCVFIELKRPRTKDLFTVRPKGRLSDDQKIFQARCTAAGVRYVVAYDWADVERSLGGLW